MFSVCSKMDYEAFLLKLCELFIVDDDDVVDEALIQWILNIGEPSIYSIQMMKDRGNSLFKEGNLSLATSLYKQALNVFCFLGLPSAHSQPASTSLALSLVLNLAACELKLSHYSQAWCFCNFVLDFEPSNVKALYRRGFALRELNFFVEALDDFEHALKFEPNNKDVSRELNSVVDCLALNPNGKRVAYHFDPLGTDRKGKKPLLNVDADTELKTLDKVVDEASCSKVVDEDSEMGYDNDTSRQSPVPFMDSDSNTESYPPLPTQCDSNPFITKPSNYSYFNKNQTHKNLYLSPKDYESLMSGRNLQFYHPKSGAYMKVRPLFSKTSILTGTPHEKFSWEAEVPSFSPLNVRPSTSMEFRPSEDLENSDNEAIHHQNVKRPCLSPTESSRNESSSNNPVGCDVATLVIAPRELAVKDVSYTLPSQTHFVFSALKTISGRRCSRLNHPGANHRSCRNRPQLKSKSLLVQGFVFCRFTNTTNTKTVEKIVGYKRKEECLFRFDDLYQSPLKKRRLCVSGIQQGRVKSNLITRAMIE